MISGREMMTFWFDIFWQGILFLHQEVRDVWLILIDCPVTFNNSKIKAHSLSTLT